MSGGGARNRGLMQCGLYQGEKQQPSAAGRNGTCEAFEPLVNVRRRSVRR